MGDYSGAGAPAGGQADASGLAAERVRFDDFIRGGPVTPFQLFDFFVDCLHSHDSSAFVADFEAAVRDACGITAPASTPDASGDQPPSSSADPQAPLPVFLSPAQCVGVWKRFVTGARTRTAASATVQANTGLVFVAQVLFWVLLPLWWALHVARSRWQQRRAAFNAAFGGAAGRPSTSSGYDTNAGASSGGGGGGGASAQFVRSAWGTSQPLLTVAGSTESRDDGSSDKPPSGAASLTVGATGARPHPPPGPQRPVSLERATRGGGAVGGSHSGASSLTKPDSSDGAGPASASESGPPSPAAAAPARTASAARPSPTVRISVAPVPSSALLPRGSPPSGAVGYGALQLARTASDALPQDEPVMEPAASYMLPRSTTQLPGATRLQRLDSPPAPHTSPFAIAVVPPTHDAGGVVPAPSPSPPPPPPSTPDPSAAGGVSLQPPAGAGSGSGTHTTRGVRSTSLAPRPSAAVSMMTRGTMSLMDGGGHASGAGTRDDFGTASTAALLHLSHQQQREQQLASGGDASDAEAQLPSPTPRASAGSALPPGGGDRRPPLLSGHAPFPGGYQSGGAMGGSSFDGNKSEAGGGASGSQLQAHARARASSSQRATPSARSAIAASYRKRLKAVGGLGVALWCCVAGTVALLWVWRLDFFVHLWDVEAYTPLVSAGLFVLLDSLREASVDADYRGRRRFIQKFTYRLSHTKCCFGLASASLVPLSESDSDWTGGGRVTAGAHKYPTNALMLFESVYAYRESAATKFKLLLASHVSLLIGFLHAVLPLAVRLTGTAASGHDAFVGGDHDADGSPINPPHGAGSGVMLNPREWLFVAVSVAANTATSTALLRSVLNGLVHFETYLWMLQSLSDVANYASNHEHQLPFRLDLNHPQNGAAWIEVRMIICRYMHSGSTTIQSVDNFIRHLQVFVVLFLAFFIAICADLFTTSFRAGSFEFIAIFDGLVFIGCVYRHIFVAANLNLQMRQHVADLRAHQFQISRALLRFREHHFAVAAATAQAARHAAVIAAAERAERRKQRSTPRGGKRTPPTAGSHTSLAASLLKLQHSPPPVDATASAARRLVPPASLTDTLSPANSTVGDAPTAKASTTAFVFAAPTGGTALPVIADDDRAPRFVAPPPAPVAAVAAAPSAAPVPALVVPHHARSQSVPPPAVRRLPNVYGAIGGGGQPAAADGPAALSALADAIADGDSPTSSDSESDGDADAATRRERRRTARALRRRRASRRSSADAAAGGADEKASGPFTPAAPPAAVPTLPRTFSMLRPAMVGGGDPYTSAILGDPIALEGGAAVPLLSGGSVTTPGAGAGGGVGSFGLDLDSDERVLGASSALLSNCIQLIHEADLPLKFWGYALEHSMLYTLTTTLTGVLVIAIANFTSFNI